MKALVVFLCLFSMQACACVLPNDSVVKITVNNGNTQNHGSGIVIGNQLLTAEHLINRPFDSITLISGVVETTLRPTSYKLIGPDVITMPVSLSKSVIPTAIPSPTRQGIVIGFPNTKYAQGGGPITRTEDKYAMYGVQMDSGVSGAPVFSCIKNEAHIIGIVTVKYVTRGTEGKDLQGVGFISPWEYGRTIELR